MSESRDFAAIETVQHEVTLMVGPNWVRIPRCSCGWTGDGTYDEGEATRKGYAHMYHAMDDQR